MIWAVKAPQVADASVGVGRTPGNRSAEIGDCLTGALHQNHDDAITIPASFVIRPLIASMAK